MDRKTFIKKTAGAVFVALPVASLVGCSCSDDGSGNNDPQGTPQGKCLEDGTVGSISNNHGHSLTISKEDVLAAVDKTYSIQGASGHDHMVTVTSANFTSLKANLAITVDSTSDGDHLHSVSIFCE